MTPEKITDHTQRVLDALTTAYGSIELLSGYLEDAAKQSTLDSVIFTDIRHDLSLPKLRSDIGQLFDILENARDNLLPEHFERLAPKPKIRETITIEFSRETITIEFSRDPLWGNQWTATYERYDGPESPIGIGATPEEALSGLNRKGGPIDG